MRFFTVAACALAVGSMVSAVHADEKIVQNVTIDGAQLRAMMQQMTPAQRAQMSKYGLGEKSTITIYTSGQKLRTDTTGASMLLDKTAKKLYLLDSETHQYRQQDFDPKAAAGMGGDVVTNVTDTGETQTLLGHTAKRYKFTMSSSGWGIKASGDVWAASDLALPETAGGGSPASMVLSKWKKEYGLPLKTSLQVTGGPIGTMTLTSEVTSVSTTSLADSTFAIPDGYTETVPTPAPKAPSTDTPPPTQ